MRTVCMQHCATVNNTVDGLCPVCYDNRSFQGVLLPTKFITQSILCGAISSRQGMHCLPDNIQSHLRKELYPQGQSVDLSSPTVALPSNNHATFLPCHDLTAYPVHSPAQCFAGTVENRGSQQSSVSEVQVYTVHLLLPVALDI